MQKLFCLDCGKELKVVESGLSAQIVTAICSSCNQSWHGLRENAERLLTQRAVDVAKYCECKVFVANYLRCKNCGLPESPRN